MIGLQDELHRSIQAFKDLQHFSSPSRFTPNLRGGRESYGGRWDEDDDDENDAGSLVQQKPKANYTTIEP